MQTETAEAENIQRGLRRQGTAWGGRKGAAGRGHLQGEAGAGGDGAGWGVVQQVAEEVVGLGIRKVVAGP